TFVHDLRARTGRGAAEVARGYRIVREVFALPELWSGIEALDSKIAARVQVEMLLDVAALVEHAAAWLLRKDRLDLGREIGRLGPSTQALAEALAELLPPRDRVAVDERAARFAAAGVPDALARRIGGITFLAPALEIADLAERMTRPLEPTARVYYGVGARFAIDDMRAAAARLPAETPWQKQAVETVIDDLFGLQGDFAERVLQSGADGADPVAAWATSRGTALAPAEASVAELRAATAPDLSMLVVAGRQLRQALG
ncbi:MAG TPA: NAD-glutamate dehydrogenase, partial [Stellaceae bacterium]